MSLVPLLPCKLMLIIFINFHRIRTIFHSATFVTNTSRSCTSIHQVRVPMKTLSSTAWVFHVPPGFPQSQNPSQSNSSASRISLSHNTTTHLIGLQNMRNLTSIPSSSDLIISLEISKTQIPSHMC